MYVCYIYAYVCYVRWCAVSASLAPQLWHLNYDTSIMTPSIMTPQLSKQERLYNKVKRRGIDIDLLTFASLLAWARRLLCTMTCTMRSLNRSRTHTLHGQQMREWGLTRCLESWVQLVRRVTEGVQVYHSMSTCGSCMWQVVQTKAAHLTIAYISAIAHIDYVDTLAQLPLPACSVMGLTVGHGTDWRNIMTC
jgi:hypothetical protein